MSLDSITKGMKLTAAFGDSFFAAEVLEVSTSKKRAKAPIKVHYNGYGAEEDAWVSLDQVKSKALKAAKGTKDKKEAAPAAAPAGAADFSALEKGTNLTALFTDGKWYGATVVAFSKKKKATPVKVHYKGYGDDEDAWLGADSLRSKLIKKGKEPAAQAAPKAAPKAAAKDAKAPDYSKLTAGMTLQALCPPLKDDKWYSATVVEVATAKKRAKAPVKVHYVGYADTEDGWLGGDQLRSKALK